jgi:hypothetical protein
MPALLLQNSPLIANLRGLMANWAARLAAAQLRHMEENLLFIAAVMQLWGRNAHHPQIPVGQATDAARFIYVYDQFVGPQAPQQINIDDQERAALAVLRNGNTLRRDSFNASFTYIVGLAFQNNLI